MKKQETVYTPQELTHRLEDLLKVLSIKPENVLVVGSMALELVGISTPIHDLDLEVRNMSEDLRKQLKILETSSLPVNGYIDHPDPNRFDIKFRGVDINIWDVSNFTCSIPLNKPGFPCSFSDPMSVIKRKKEYGRLKDFKALQGLAIKILEPLQKT